MACHAADLTIAESLGRHAYANRGFDDGRIILNLATVDDLVRLPGIGRKRAKAIVALRQRLGKFRRLRDLLRIRGIAYRSLRRLKPHVLLDRPAPVRVGQGGASSG